MADQRPNPDALLEKLQQEQTKQRRGYLKIFFGGCAGVGKTFAMLAKAQELRLQLVDVIVGVIETHGRLDTEAQLGGLEILPRLNIDYRGHKLTEFDLDAALKRHPSLILVDELAHTNAAGSRHPKRWQDIEELLAAGINVYTTLNVQHLESLNDVVGQITGIRVFETVPDKVFDQADDVTLVDLPPDELLRRMKEGKVYIEQQANQASLNFFRKGNLIALRELALRRTADRVDAQMREYRTDQAIKQVWQAKDRLLACIGSGSNAEQLIRVTARLAASLRADWLAVYVETPALQKLTDQQREGIFRTLKLAQELGAETTTLTGTQVSSVLLSYARSRNVSKLVVGKPRHAMLWRLIKPSVTDRLAADAKDVDVYIVGSEMAQEVDAKSPRKATAHGLSDFEPRRASRHRGYVIALVSTALTTLVAEFLSQYFDLSNIIMFYLLGVILVSSKYGRGAGVLASLLSVAAFDLFFVPPRLSFTVADTQYLLTFFVMLTLSLVISNLTSNLLYQARVATHRERRSRVLYDLGKELASALTSPQIIEMSTHHLSGEFQSKVAVLLPDSHEKVRILPGEGNANASLENVDYGIAQWVYDHEEQAGFGTNTLPSSKVLYVPLKAPMRTRGVLAIAPENPGMIFFPEQRRLFDTFASQIALALERVHYVEVAQDALISMESERLRNSLLSAISHDLRTPLTSIIGIATTLKEQAQPEDVRLEMFEALQEQAFRMNGLMTNLLDMARLQAGKVQLNKQWQMLEEVVGGALHGMQHLLLRHHVQVNLPYDLPLLQFDAVLIERVLSNLLDNASKYTPAEAHIGLSAEVREDEVWISVADDGTGLPAGMETQIFEKFTRGEKESAKPGVGLGLSICRAIVEAHGGKIWAKNLPDHGAVFVFSLPIGKPPALPELEAVE